MTATLPPILLNFQTLSTQELQSQSLFGSMIHDTLRWQSVAGHRYSPLPDREAIFCDKSRTFSIKELIALVYDLQLPTMTRREFYRSHFTEVDGKMVPTVTRESLYITIIAKLRELGRYYLY